MAVDYLCKLDDPKKVIFLKLFAYLAVAGCIVGLVYTVLMLLPSETAKEMGMKYHGIDQWGDNSLQWVSSDTEGFYAWKYAISILSALFSVIKTAYEFTESIFLANRISEAHREDEADPHQRQHRDSYVGKKEGKMNLKHLLGGMVLLLLLALTNAMPIYDVGFKTLMFGVKVVMFGISIKYVKAYMHPHGFRSFGNWITFGRFFKDQSHGAHDHHHSKTESSKEIQQDPAGSPLDRALSRSYATMRSPDGDSWQAPGEDTCTSEPAASTPPATVLPRRLAAFDASSILSTVVITLVSLLVWYLFLRGPASQVKPRRRTTIIKKRPTFAKGKRKASRKPTLSTLRSEGNLVN